MDEWLGQSWICWWLLGVVTRCIILTEINSFGVLAGVIFVSSTELAVIILVFIRLIVIADAAVIIVEVFFGQRGDLIRREAVMAGIIIIRWVEYNLVGVTVTSGIATFFDALMSLISATLLLLLLAI